MKSFFLLLVSLLLLFTGCQQEIITSRSVTVYLTDAGNDPQIKSYKVELLTGTGKQTYASQELTAPGSVTFSSVELGTYIALASAYGEDKDNPLYSEYRTVSVTPDKTPAVTIILHTKGEIIPEGQLQVDVSWTEGIAIDEIRLVDENGDVISTFSPQDGESQTVALFTVPADKETKAHLEFFNSGILYGTSDAFSFSVQEGDSSTVVEDVTAELAEPVYVKNLVVKQILPSFTSLAVSFLAPEEDYDSIVISYQGDNTSRSFEISKLNVESHVDEENTYSMILENLKDDTEYTVSAYILFRDETTSMSAECSAMTPALLESVELSLPEGMTALLPGCEPFSLQLVRTPVHAADLGGTWTSSNPDIITVNEEGLIEVKTFGSATVTYISANNNVKASIQLTAELEKPQPVITPMTDCINLEWQTYSRECTFTVWKKTNGANPVCLTPEPIKETAFTDTDVDGDHGYSYQVCATDVETGVSFWSFYSDDFRLIPIPIQITLARIPEIGLEITSSTEEVTGGSILSVSVENTAGLDSCQWLINGTPETEENAVSTEFEFEIPYVSSSYYPMQVMQELTLVINGNDGHIYSTSLWIVLNPETTTEMNELLSRDIK